MPIMESVAELRDDLHPEQLVSRVLADTHIEEHMFPLTSWQDRCPVGKKMATLLLSDHLQYPQRFQLTLFMLNNKCKPTVYANQHWLLWAARRHAVANEDACLHVAGYLCVCVSCTHTHTATMKRDKIACHTADAHTY